MSRAVVAIFAVARLWILRYSWAAQHGVIVTPPYVFAEILHAVHEIFLANGAIVDLRINPGVFKKPHQIIRLSS